MPRYYLFLFFTCLFQSSLAQEWGNPYHEKLAYFVGQPYETAVSALKEGKTVKSLVIASYTKGFGQPLEQFTDVEQVSLELSRVDSVQLEITFQQLSRLPKLHYLSISSFSGQDAKALVLPAGIEKLTSLRGINFMNRGKNNIQSLWNALPNLKSLEALQLSFPENVTTLPNEIRNCKNLKSLSLSIPFLTTFPEWLGELSSLEYLHLNALYDRPIPRTFPDIHIAKLSSLKSLQIDNFSIKGTDLMGLNPSKKSLVVNNCRVADSNTFFESINKVPSVEKLSLMNLQIQPPSPEIKLRLPNLKHLTITSLYTDSLRKNRWEGIPDGLVESSQLKFLYLGNVLGENLPKGIENLVELESLNLSNNRLKELPDLGRLTSLKILLLQTNQLTVLPKSIGKLAKLEILDASSNQLTELPEGIFNSPNIKRIQLNNNQLTSLPSSITKLKNLSELNISSNQLKEFPNKLGELTSLQTFGFAINDISSLPASIGQLKRLRFLNAGHNPLKILPETLGDCDSLQNLQINNCLLETLPSSIGKLKQLMFLGLTDQENYYAPINSGSTNIQPRPAKYRNQLRRLPLSLVQCQKLRNLDLSQNIHWDKDFLWPFVQSFRNPDITISLRNCNLDSVPATGWKDTQIQNLELSGNQIHQLSPEWFIAKGIRMLILTGNKLVPNTLNKYYNSLEERLLVAEEAGMEVPKPFPDTKEMARAYVSQARQKMNTGDIPKFVAYVKEAERIDVTQGRWDTELWGRFYFHTHQYRMAADTLTVLIDRYFKTIKELARPAQRGLPIAPIIDFRAQAKWRLGDSLGAIKDYEMMVEDYKLFAPNLWGRLGVWYKLYRPTTGKSGAAFDKAIGMYEMVRNQPPMVQMSAAEVYLMSEQADKAYEYIYGINQDNYKPDEKILAEYLLLCAQIAQKKANESELRAFESKLKKLEFKVKNWSYQLLEDSLSAWNLEKEYIEQLHQLTKAMKAQSVVVD